MQVEYLIVGQGIAGTVLAYTLLKHGKKILVIDDRTQASSSRVAAGIFNPITGRRLSKTWQADQLFPFLLSFYRELEAELGQSFLHEINMYYPFSSIEEQNTWIGQSASPQYTQYTDVTIPDQAYSAFTHNPFGGMEIKPAGYVNLHTLLTAFKQYLTDRSLYRQDRFSYSDVQLAEESVNWRGIVARKVLFCEGVYGQQSPYFKWLPFRPVKGETLLVSIPGMPQNRIINRGVFVLPLGEDTFRVGATYSWHDLNWEPSPEARQELVEKLRSLIKLPFQILDQQAGIRPASPNRRPIIGLHPEWKTLGIFNGLGSKGVSLAPYFAHCFVQNLEMGKELPREVQIERFFSLYTSI